MGQWGRERLRADTWSSHGPGPLTSTDPDLWPSEAFVPQSSLVLTWVLFCPSSLPAFLRTLCLKGKRNALLVLFFKSKEEAGKAEGMHRGPSGAPAEGWELVTGTGVEERSAGVALRDPEPAG